MIGPSPLPGRQKALLALLLAAVVASNVRQPFPEVAPLQHIPTLVALAAAPRVLRRWPMPTHMVAMAVGFLLLHTLAGRYIYTYTPYAAWAEALGLTLSPARNGMDRLVHLAFGLLVAPVARTALRRHGGAGPYAARIGAIGIVATASAGYEIFEWLLSIAAAPDMADTYNGQQGDPWDAQKDMALAIGGAVIASGFGARNRR